MAEQQTQHAGRLIREPTHSQAKRGWHFVQAGRMVRALAIFFICCALAGITNADTLNAPTASLTPPPLSPLAAKYHQLKNELAQSSFGSPILLRSEIGDKHVQGEVYALLDAPFAALRETLSQPAHWCELTILHINVKTCTYLDDRVQLFVGRKHYQTPEEAYLLQYRFAQLMNTDHNLQIKLTAPDGPLGTSDYLISLEATPIDRQHSFIHFQYRYRFGFMAKMALQTYLATLGRDKIGFTVVGTDENGEAIYIKGLQGVIERNVMRYIFAIQSVFETEKSVAEKGHSAQLARWYAHIQQHPRQLMELSREEYMSNKLREYNNQLEAQRALLP